jgi:drug/metabolite transporter (DMT)-like permease
MEWYVFAMLGAVFTGFAAITHKKTMKNVEALEFSTVLAIVNLLISIPILLNTDFSLIGRNAFLLIFFCSLFATGGFLFVSKAIKHMEVSDSSPFFTFGPAIIALLAFLFLGETLNFIQIFGIFFVMAGAYVLEIKEPLKILKNSKYVRYIFFALVIYGFGSMIDRVLLSSTGNYALNPITYLAIIHGFIALNFVFLTFLLSKGFHSIENGFKKTGAWIIVLAVLVWGYRFFQGSALADAPNVAFVSAIKRASILIPVVIGGKLFHEHNLKQKMLASIIMIIGSALIILF